ncbi:PD-(D/E)XK nuclease domain-containing protein [Flavobacterium sp.]|uniref:PD-(D/E)XK nuclease domain-containing protein n=1 Tax=Flavobacterium sp. TaxID=239 RepID=UPI003751A522
MKKVLKIESYIHEFFSTRYSNIKAFYDDENKHRQIGIYKLEKGSELLQFLFTILSCIENNLYVKKLVPQVYSTPKKLVEGLNWFKKYLIENQNLLDINDKGENTSYVIQEIQIIKTELEEMIDYLLQIYDSEDNVIPYEELRYSLITRDLDSFFVDMNSILASVSYAILKTKEGYLHSNIHLIIKLLGFDIISEEQTNIGRIDAVIRFSNIIYIFEFKLGTSDEALKQIKEKKYYEKYIIERKEIIMVGVGFDNKERNIKDYKMEIYK